MVSRLGILDTASMFSRITISTALISDYIIKAENMKTNTPIFMR